MERFTLSQDEIDAIVSRDVPVDRRFFSAMDKAERIRDDCRVLMAGEDGPTEAGYVYKNLSTSRVDTETPLILASTS